MRLWSIHPKYLDSRGLVACWREGLLARKVLSGQTVGYRQHPQLVRFRAQSNPMEAIDGYLGQIYEEACARGYRFDGSKIVNTNPVSMSVTTGQLHYELEHLRVKLLERDRVCYDALKNVVQIEPNPVFVATEGDVESWEVVNYGDRS